MVTGRIVFKRGTILGAIYAAILTPPDGYQLWPHQLNDGQALAIVKEKLSAVPEKT
jgi:hypothetical protein